MLKEKNVITILSRNNITINQKIIQTINVEF